MAQTRIKTVLRDAALFIVLLCVATSWIDAAARNGDTVTDVWLDPADGVCVVATSELRGWPRLHRDTQRVEVYDTGSSRRPAVCDR